MFLIFGLTAHKGRYVLLNYEAQNITKHEMQCFLITRCGYRGSRQRRSANGGAERSDGSKGSVGIARLSTSQVSVKVPCGNVAPYEAEEHKTFAKTMSR
jgi:hypothetical protein